MATLTPASSPDMPIMVKIVFTDKDENRKFKLPLRELGANSLPDKLRSLLSIPSTHQAVFERYSDSSSSFITLDPNVPSVYKQLARAAKAKQKLKIRVTVVAKEETKPAEMHKAGSALPERLSTRCYIYPHVSDPLKANVEPIQIDHERSTSPEKHDSPSSATLVVPEKPNPEASSEISTSPTSSPHKSYHWPMSREGEFSEATKRAFEKKEVGPKECGAKNVVGDEAPLPRVFTDHKDFLIKHPNMSQQLESLNRASERNRSAPFTNFSICCNNCQAVIPDAHWHCGICDKGDFDLCRDCVEKGHLCEDDEHWLIKRFVKDGKVIPSTTETIGPKQSGGIKHEEKVPGAFTSELKREEIPMAPRLDLSRTCNSCVGVFEESNFVTCLNCDDYDLCIPCHVGLKHGHHPSHTFAPASKETQLTALAYCLCAPGRSMRHLAVCDGCDQDIWGVRHKCMNCPDFDYCSTCFKDAHKTHPGHHLVPLYEPISMRVRNYQHHRGIYCDGPLCSGKDSYIVGDRYKCAVCHDTDFCANCEAIPKLEHNRTHPLIKFKTPVRNVSVTTMGEKPNGEQMRTMGDQPPQTSSKSTETTHAAASANAATQVQTVAEVMPTEVAKEEPKSEAILSRAAEPVATPELRSVYVSDVIADGSIMAPSHRFTQTWTLRNPGPHRWPAGCCAWYIGGDGMLDIDPNHPSHVSQMYKASKSNVIDRVVEVGEEIEIHVTLRTPEKKGSFVSYWRLKDADGMPFGHKIWCDVEVRCPDPAEQAEEQAQTEHIEDISKHAAVEDEVKEDEEQQKSKMIFPTLEKESPVSSTHEAQASQAPIAPVTAEKELLEDVESLELDDGSDSDEAFLTDEEYELIASDDELETSKNGKK